MFTSVKMLYESTHEMEILTLTNAFVLYLREVNLLIDFPLDTTRVPEQITLWAMKDSSVLRAHAVRTSNKANAMQ